MPRTCSTVATGTDTHIRPWLFIVVIDPVQEASSRKLGWASPPRTRSGARVSIDRHRKSTHAGISTAPHRPDCGINRHRAQHTAQHARFQDQRITACMRRTHKATSTACTHARCTRARLEQPRVEQVWWSKEYEMMKTPPIKRPYHCFRSKQDLGKKKGKKSQKTVERGQRLLGKPKIIDIFWREKEKKKFLLVHFFCLLLAFFYLYMLPEHKPGGGGRASQ